MGTPNWKHPAVWGGEFAAKLKINGRWRSVVLVGGPYHRGGFAICLGNEVYGNWETSFAHLFEDGNIRQFGQVIATLDDLRVTKKLHKPVRCTEPWHRLMNNCMRNLQRPSQYATSK